MALQCPQCANSIEADFGVVTCPQCQSVLFIDMEGQIQLSDTPDSQVMFEVMPTAPAEAPVQDLPPAEFQDSWMQDQNPVVIDVTEAPGGRVPTPGEPLPDSIAEMQPESFQENIFEDEETVPSRLPNDLSEVAKFSNSDQAYGPLSYSVTIEEIDTKETRQQLAEALNDPKFQWDSRELLKKIKMGKLQLENLNPVKASVLVYRLQALPVKVSWTQNVFS